MSSDAKLREDLKKLGVSVGPITDSTRSLYKNRLEKLKNQNEKKTPVPRVEVKRLVGKPVTMPPKRRSSSPVLRTTRKRNSTRYSADESDEDNAKEEAPAVPASTRQKNRNSFSTSKQMEVKSRTPVHKRVKALTNSRKSTPQRRSDSFKDQDRYSDDSSDASESGGSWIEMQSEETNTSPSLASSLSNEDKFRFRRRNGENNDSRRETDIWGQNEIDEAKQDFQRRMLQEKMRILRDIEVEEESFTHGNGSIVSSSGNSRRMTENQQTKKNSKAGDNVQKQPWTLNFSSFLPIGTCIFFIILGLLYATMKYDTSLNSTGLHLDYDRNQNPSEQFLVVASQIYDCVGRHAGEKLCGISASQSEHMSITEVSRELDLKNGQNIHTALKKFIETPEWGILVYNDKQEHIKDAERYKEAKFIDSNQPILSGWCRFTRAVQKVLLRILLTTAAGILIWLGLVYRRYRIEKQREDREQMYVMVQKILDVLRKQYDLSENNDSIQPFLPILHVRDMILPPQDRKKMEKIWEKAKQFLSASETRIRVENQRILGEDYLVWRWIQAASPAKRYTQTSRIWQGEAFNISKSINRPMICPTPCLKIRNMFDVDMEDSKGWVQQIQDSILEKCQGNHEILRICVEKESKEGLVYMLCDTNEAAGRAFQALHGAWFDGRLVTVKFIRLERFHHRFPDSVNQSRVPMRPTSAVPVSTIMSSPSGPNETQAYEKLYPTLPDD